MKQYLKYFFVVIGGFLVVGNIISMNNNNNSGDNSASSEAQEGAYFIARRNDLIKALRFQKTRNVQNIGEFCKFVIQVNRCLDLFLKEKYLTKMSGAMKLNLVRTLTQYWNIVLYHVDIVLREENPRQHFLCRELQAVCDYLINGLWEWSHFEGLQNVYCFEQQIWAVFYMFLLRDFRCMIDDVTSSQKRELIVSLGSIASHCRRLLIFGSKLTQENKQAYNQAIIKKIREHGLEIKKILHDKSKREELIKFFKYELYQLHYFFFPDHESIR